MQHRLPPPCTSAGWDDYVTCTRCDYTTYVRKRALGHDLFGEWTHNADDAHTTACLRGCGYGRTEDCTLYCYAILADDVRTEFSLCPVCGDVIEPLAGVKLPVEGASAEALTEALPEGALVVRMGALESGEMLLSVVFEADGDASFTPDFGDSGSSALLIRLIPLA